MSMRQDSTLYLWKYKKTEHVACQIDVVKPVHKCLDTLNRQSMRYAGRSYGAIHSRTTILLNILSYLELESFNMRPFLEALNHHVWTPSRCSCWFWYHLLFLSGKFVGGNGSLEVWLYKSALTFMASFQQFCRAGNALSDLRFLTCQTLHEAGQSIISLIL